ncbi:DUF7673 family protein [Azohydromonas australica]|uniref:DUF7673 family protein n=1 Tax=Azohydromonas australica TaxID=364039 RepID=UPI000429836F|nr:hypothetical protein [Azohydromonas australica]
MASDDDPTPQPTVTVTVQIPVERRMELERLLHDFASGKVRAIAPAFDFAAHDYRGAAQMLVHDPDTTYTLRSRILEDDKRDPTAALADAEQLHALQAKRFNEAGDTAPVADGRAGQEQTGVEALRRLFEVAKGSSAQCGRVARFLLGLYNGARFPFELTQLRSVEEAVLEDAVRVLRMDASLVGREVHEYLAHGGPEFERLAETWYVLDVHKLKRMVKELSRHIPADGPYGQAVAELVRYVEDNH